MSSQAEGTKNKTCWFVGASYGGNKDQTDRFVKGGEWENGYQNKYIDDVNSIQPGDCIAIKSTYTRKHKLPFDNLGHTVSVMIIKAIGTVTKNLGNGRTVKVDWTKLDTPREWYFYSILFKFPGKLDFGKICILVYQYVMFLGFKFSREFKQDTFYTYRGTIWRVLPGEWYANELISFTFEDKSQDLSRFKNSPYWRERFGDTPSDKHQFLWTSFYMELAEKLLGFQHKRLELITGIHAIAQKVTGLSNLQDQFSDDSTGPLKDICPFATT